MHHPEIKRRLALGLTPRPAHSNHRKTSDRMFAVQMLLAILGLLAIVLAFAPN